LKNDCIGVFDSGLGGLSVMRHLMAKLPQENMIYFGDTARVPYGTRSEETIIRYTESDIRFLKTFPVKLVVVACGTASSVALPHLVKENFPICGVVEVTANAAASATRNKKVGILGTQGTIKSKSYETIMHKQDSSIETYPMACPLFVPLVENGCLHDEIAYLAAKKYLLPLKEKGIDTLILGCTHYPLLSEVIADIMGKDVVLIDPGEHTAVFVESLLQKENTKAPSEQKGRFQYYVSDSVQDFSKVGSLFLGQDITEQVKKIDIEQY